MPYLLCLALISIAALTASAAARADEVCIQGLWHSGVVVTESASSYYIQFPDSGEMRTLTKSGLPTEHVRRNSTHDERQALRAQWAARRGAANDAPVAKAMREAALAPAAASASSEAEDIAPSSMTLRLRGDVHARPADTSMYATDGTVDYIRLRNVPMGDALDAMLRPMGLDYEVAPYGLFISTPDRLRRESRERVQTRVYHMAPAGDTLPKIVLANPAAVVSTGGFGGSFGGGGISGGGIGGGFNGGLGGGNRAGGLGGGGFGGGLGGGAGIGAISPVSQIGNISQLFSTIDDARVGEAPAQIATVGIVR